MEIDNYAVELDDIPEEVMVHIFSFLSPKMVKVCTLVSKRWTRVIEESREIMSKYVLNLEDRPKSEIEKALKFVNRKQSSLRTSSMTMAVKEIVVGNKLRCLQISNCSVDATCLNECLKELNLLESFTGKTVRLDGKSELKRVKFEKLQELRVEYSDIELILAFDATTLVKAHFTPSTVDRGASAVLQLLKNQTKLQSLTIGGYLSKDFMNLHGINDFAIGTLRCFRIERGPLGNVQHDRLIKFFATHRETITKLELIYPVDASVYIYVHNMTQLVHLDVPVNVFSRANTVLLSKLAANNNIQSLRLVGTGFTGLSRATSLFDLFPALTRIDLSDLTIDALFMKILLHLAITKPQLTVLKIPNLFYDFNWSIYFPKLREFYVKRTHYDDHYIRFVERHMNTLESIAIGSTDCDFLKQLIVETIIACPNIKYVSIAAKTVLVLRKFTKLVEKNHEWTLLVNFKGLTGLKYAKVKFHFPQDRLLFQDKVSVHSKELISDFQTFADDTGLNTLVNKYK